MKSADNLDFNNEYLLKLHQGHYQDVVDGVQSNEKNTSDLTALICSLAFIGQQIQAENLWLAKKNLLNLRQQLRCCLHLAIVETRRSNLKKARFFLKLNLKTDSKLFYPDTLQGIAFYHYYLGHYLKAIKFAERAYRSSIKVNDNYLELLSLDVIAHCHVQTGRLSSGLKLFEDINARTQTLNYDKLQIAVDTAKFSYEIEAGYYFALSAQKIIALQSQVSVKDAYTQTNIAMLLARQYILMGKWQEAEDLLHKTAPVLYGFENRRQEVHLHIRFADIALRRNDIASAQHFIHSARLCLQQIVDKTFEIRVLLMEYKIKKAQSDSPVLMDLQEQIDSLFYKYPFFFDPLFSAAVISVRLDEVIKEKSPLQKLYQLSLMQPRQAFQQATGYLYFGLFPTLLNLPSGDVLCVTEANQIIGKDRMGIRFLQGKLSQLQIRILLFLNNREVASKSDLIESVWKYTYDPIRHDAMVYAAIVALRKSIEPFGGWIETTDEGWRLRVSMCLLGSQKPMPVKNSLSKNVKDFLPLEVSGLSSYQDQSGLHEFDEALNYRQLQACKRFPELGHWTVPTYQNYFKISTMTAWRDLNLLVKSKIFRVRGHGKLTSYHLCIRPKY
jgi:DNA-binding winged helix-turn-helix (wHTH) protein